MGEMMVKVAKLGSVVQEVCVTEGSTLGEALVVAGEVSEGYDVRINAGAVSSDTVLSNGDIVTLVPAIKGGI